MTRWAVAFLVIASVAACGPTGAASTTRAMLPTIPVCDGQPQETSPDRPYRARECKLVTPDQTFHVAFAEAQGADNGSVTIDVLDHNGVVAQTIREAQISDYADPEAIDFDEDGHIDLEIPLIVGNDNRDLALWRYDPAQSHFVRLGDVSGIIHRTADGYLAVASKGSAAEWDVTFNRIGSDALQEVVTLDVAAEGDDQGNVARTTCTISHVGSEFSSLGMTEEAARAKFCAEPAARVFDQ